MKKILWVLGVVVALVIVLVVAAGVIVYMTVTKDFIASKMSAALNRHVTIDRIDVSLFSVVSGIEVKNLAVSNFKTPKEMAALAGKPVPADDLFTGLETLRFKMKFLPLLQLKVELKELSLIRPVVNLSKNRHGVLNIDDLIKSKKQPPAEQKKEKAAPAKPLSAEDLPVAVSVGEIGIKNATVNYFDGQYDQTFRIYDFTALLHDIEIDPKTLEKSNVVEFTIATGVKTVGSLKTGSVQNFDVTLDATGRIIPLDPQTRLLNPEVVAGVKLPSGEITGLQIFNAIAQVPMLGEYLGEYLAFLKGTQKWSGSKDNRLDLRYKDGQVDIKDGRLNLDQAGITFDGGMNLASKAVAMNLNLLMNQEINDRVLTSLTKKIDAAIKSPDVKKYVNTSTLAQTAIKPLLNDGGFIELGATVGGTTQKPMVQLSRPQLNSIGAIVKSAVADAAMDAAKGAIKEKAGEFLKEDQKKLLEGVGGLLKRK